MVLLRPPPELIPEPQNKAVSHLAIPIAWYITAVRLVDLVLLVLSGVVASYAVGLLGSGAGLGAAVGERVLATALAALAAGCALRQLGAYEHARLMNPRLRAILLAGSIAAGAGAATACLELLPVARSTALLWPAAWAAAALAQCLAMSAVSAAICRAWHAAGSLTRRVAVVGLTPLAEAFIDHARDAAHGVSVIGLYDDRDQQPHPTAGPAQLHSLADLVAQSRSQRIDAIVLALPLWDVERVSRASAFLRSVPADIYVATNIDPITARARRQDCISGHSVVRIATRPLDDWQMLQKAVFDRVLAALLLAALLPALAAVALAIRLDSPGPVLFRQPRQGFNGAMFKVYKFRSMFHSMADLTATRQTRRGDPRITRIGRLLRKFSIDEVPQLINVLQGEMSLVGPRPHAPNTRAGDTLFHEAVADYALRHRVKPGITGWAQVNGWRGETRTQVQLEQRVAHDLHYIDNWSLLLDLKILVLTVLREINSRVAF